MHNQPNPSTQITAAGYAWAVGALVALASLAVLVWLDAQRLATPPRVVGNLIAATAAVCGSGFVVQLSATRVMQQIDQIGEKVTKPQPWGPSSVRRSLAVQQGARLALADPAIVEATERRRLLVAHLREQFDAEIESRVDDALVEGFEIGYRARAAEEGDSKP